MKKLHYDGPVVLVILDGVGLSTRRSGNAVRQAYTEFLDHAMLNYLNIPLAASGEAVGILPGQMGNSEVGHNTIGSGQIIRQGIAQIEAAFVSGDIWQSKGWRGSIHNVIKNDSTLHFAGIFSDGGVHSDIKHLERMVEQAYAEGIRRIRVHALFDGRDVAPQSEPRYIERFEKFCSKFRDADFRIADGGGRMAVTADRYGNDWRMVQLGYDLMTRGASKVREIREFTSARTAIETLRLENPGLQDQYIPPFVIVEPAAERTVLAGRAIKAKRSSAAALGKPKPVGLVEDGDSMIYIDFRADRAVEIAEAFTSDDFDKFPRARTPEVYFAGLTEYSADRHIPAHVLVPPVKITSPLNTFLGTQGITQFAISETVKFGHITYYFNGNSYKKARGEVHQEIPSDVDTALFVQRPWMKSAEITDAALAEMGKYRFVRINYPGGDMVGHFGELEPAIVAMEAIDLQLARLARRVDELGGMMIITADHGNAEESIDAAGQPKTSHTTNPVPCIFYDNTANRRRYKSADLPAPGLANLASTITGLLDLDFYPPEWQKPLIK